MPLRTITLPDGKTVSRVIENVHPNGAEFLPEELEIGGDTPEGKRAVKLLSELLE